MLFEEDFIERKKSEFSRIDTFNFETTCKVLSVLPSEKDRKKNCLLKILFEMKDTNPRLNPARNIERTKNIIHLISTEAAMPIVMAAKYIESSKGDLTGFLNLTIDKAPTIPSDKAIFPDITFVITNVIIGRKVSVPV